jgi:hypothetical protein
MKFLRSVAGYTLLDQKWSSELKIFSLTERIEKQKENWHEHILRMTADRLTKVLLNYKSRGYRNIGRPMARWENAFSWSWEQACGLYPWSRIRRNINNYNERRKLQER